MLSTTRGTGWRRAASQRKSLHLYEGTNASHAEQLMEEEWHGEEWGVGADKRPGWQQCRS